MINTWYAWASHSIVRSKWFRKQIFKHMHTRETEGETKENEFFNAILTTTKEKKIIEKL